MKTEQEIELKNIIFEKKYHELMLHFLKISSEKKTYTQTNYYFDDETLSLKKSKVTFRIRKKEIDNITQWELTAKIPHPTQHSKEFNSHMEYHVDLNEETALLCLQDGISKQTEATKEIFSVLEKECSIPESIQFKSIGNLKTIRTDFKIQNETVSLDQSFYNGIIDWEIEWETSLKKLHITKEKWLSLGLSIMKSRGKKSRFFETL